ncbi:YbjO family protein [Erwinia tracheiphila]|nr:YbjO family protein [Erwinia tracheiphila]UIA86662.1 YbjO family protein [Erwinia tracheiphila]UIA95017.1 YbjO family protein [Erwinia tracheiphila]
MHEFGINELLRFIHRSAQAWDPTLIFIISQLLFFMQLRCALVLLWGRCWGRWCYADTIGGRSVSVFCLNGMGLP